MRVGSPVFSPPDVMSDDIETLRRQEWFETLSDPSLERLIETSERRTLMTGGSLWSQGDRTAATYILLSGCVEMTDTVQPDGQRTEQIDEAGALLGLAALAGDWSHESSAYTVERTEVLRLERETFEEMFEARRAVAHRLIDAMAEQLVDEMRDANQRLREVFGQPGETLRTLRRRARSSERR